MFGNSEKPQSLIERKKMQWAKEREELSKLTAPWGSSKSIDIKLSSDRTLARITKPETHQKLASTNLPTIYKNNGNVISRFENEGETSGYASDNVHISPEYYQGVPEDYKLYSEWGKRVENSAEPSTPGDEAPKWVSRIAGENYWDPTELEDSAPPAWVQRGLKSTQEVMMLSHSPDHSYHDFNDNRSVISLGNSLSRSYIRGQNVPLDPIELAERERKRIKAIEHQNAIKQQLEERERKRKEDLEKRKREELEEEYRIMREQEIERRRVEEEQKAIRMKQEKDRKKEEVMQEALVCAEREAKMAKMRQREMRLTQGPLITEIPYDEPNETPPKPEPTPPPKSPIENKCLVVSQKLSLNSPDSAKRLPSPVETPKPDTVDSMKAEALALVLPSQLNNSLQGVQLALILPATNPLPISAIPAVPVSAATDRSTSTSESRLLTPSLYRKKANCCDVGTQTEFEDTAIMDLAVEKFVPDERYGSLDRCSDSSRGKKEKDGRRMKSEDRSRESLYERPKWGANKPPMRYMTQSEKDPMYQKKKLRQKMQEIRAYEEKSNTFSSEESSPETPENRIPRKPVYINKSRTRGLWRKNERLIAQNVRVYQTEILPLESDRQGRIYIKNKSDIEDRHVRFDDYYSEAKISSNQINSVEILKINHSAPRPESRKDMNDKYNEQRKRIEPADTSETTDREGEVLEGLKDMHRGLVKKNYWNHHDASNPTSSSSANEIS